MFDLILFQPEIPPNTGNIIRLCANTGTRLHLIEPLGFAFEDRHLRRAGLDYRDLVIIARHANLQACMDSLGPRRIFACSTRGTTRHTEPRFARKDVFMFGPETRGLPVAMLDELPVSRVLRIPMHPGNRSLNLSNAAAVIIYEAWRQQEFAGAAGHQGA